jgi:hypothetical protein
MPDLPVAQIRLTGDAATVAALVVLLTSARIDGVQFALHPARPGRTGDEHLAYGTVRLVEPPPTSAPDGDEYAHLAAQLTLTRQRFETMKASLSRSAGARADAEKLLASGRGGMLRRPARQLLTTLREIEHALL